MKKNVPWHILAPSAVACDMFLLRASAHPRGAFFVSSDVISYETKKRMTCLHIIRKNVLFLLCSIFTNLPYTCEIFPCPYLPHILHIASNLFIHRNLTFRVYIANIYFYHSY